MRSLEVPKFFTYSSISLSIAGLLDPPKPGGSLCPWDEFPRCDAMLALDAPRALDSRAAVQAAGGLAGCAAASPISGHGAGRVVDFG